MTGTGTKDDPYIPDGSWDEFLEAVGKINDPDNDASDAYVKMPPNIEYDLSKIYSDGGGTRQFWWNCTHFDGNGLVIKNGQFKQSEDVAVFQPRGKDGVKAYGWIYTYSIENTTFKDIEFVYTGNKDNNNPSYTNPAPTSFFGARSTYYNDGSTGSRNRYIALWNFLNCEFQMTLVGRQAFLTNDCGGTEDRSWGNHSFESCNLRINAIGLAHDDWLIGYNKRPTTTETGTYQQRVPSFNNCKIHVEIQQPHNVLTGMGNPYGSCNLNNCYVEGDLTYFNFYRSVTNSIFVQNIAKGLLGTNGAPITTWDELTAFVKKHNDNSSYKCFRMMYPVGTIVREGPEYVKNNGYALPRLPAEDITNPKALHDAGLPIDPGE